MTHTEHAPTAAIRLSADSPKAIRETRGRHFHTNAEFVQRPPAGAGRDPRCRKWAVTQSAAGGVVRSPPSHGRNPAYSNADSANPTRKVTSPTPGACFTTSPLKSV